MKKIITYDKVCSLYQETLDNGINLYLAPDKRRNAFNIYYTVDLGGAVDKYRIGKKDKKAPLGIAHFIEHQLFNTPDGESVGQKLTDLGAVVNAYTAHKGTAYYVNGVKHFNQCLEILLDFVNTPYFEEKSVETEKDIIIKELDLYRDDPHSVAFESVIANVIHNHPMRHSIGGTNESVRNTTVDDLYNVYEAFYQPKYANIVITGNFDLEIAKELTQSFFNNRTSQDLEVIPIFDKEPPEVVKRSGFKKMDVITPKCELTFKIPKVCNSLDMKATLNIFFSAEFSSTSEFMEKYDAEIYGLNWMLLDINDYLIVTFEYESDDPIKTKKDILKTLKNIPTEEAFDYIMKSFEARFMTMIDNANVLGESLAMNLIDNKEIIDYASYYKVFTYKKLCELLPLINFDEYSYFEIKPK